MSEAIVAAIHASRKYRAVYLPTVTRIVASCLKIYGPEKAEDEARNLLHQIWGAYYGMRPDFNKILKKNLPLEAILRLHASTAERLPFARDFYGQIFAALGEVTSVVDYGCGLNPLLYASLNMPARYQGFDIDTEEIEFLKKELGTLQNTAHITVAPGDVLSDPLVAADAILLLKMLPVLEQQEKGSSLRVLTEASAPLVVVSYPIASLSGKEKGMLDFYSTRFYELIAETDWEVEELVFPTELVFIIRK